MYEHEEDGKHIVTSEILFTDDGGTSAISTDNYIVNTVIITDETDNYEAPAQEIESTEISENTTENFDDEYDSYELVDEADDSDEYYEDIQITGYVPFSAKMIDISTKLTNEEHKTILLVEDANGNFLTVGNGDSYLAIDRIDGLDTNEASVVSKNFIDNILKETEEKATELTKDTYKENQVATVNGVATEEK